MYDKARGKQKASPIVTEDPEGNGQDEGGSKRREDVRGEGSVREGGDIEIDENPADEIEVVCLFVIIELETLIFYVLWLWQDPKQSASSSDKAKNPRARKPSAKTTRRSKPTSFKPSDKVPEAPSMPKAPSAAPDRVRR